MLNSKEISNQGVINIYSAVIEQAVHDWKKGYIYLMKNVGYINSESFVMDQFSKSSKVIKYTRLLNDADKFLRSDLYMFYAETIECYFPYDTLVKHLKERANEIIFG